MRGRSIVAVLIFLGITERLFAQDVLNELTVDRPGIAETPYTVHPGAFQFEVGYDYYSRHDGKIFYYPNILLRSGISKRIEIRVAAKQITDRTESTSVTGLSPISIGFKSHLMEQIEWIPEMDILANVVFPVGSGPLQPGRVGPEVLLLFQNDLYPNSAINYNIGYLWDASLEKNVFTGSLCYNYLPSEKLGLFAEYFCFVPHNDGYGEQGLDAGFTYLVGQHVQFDLSGGYSLLKGKNNFFASSGFSVRLAPDVNKKKRLANAVSFNFR